MYFEHFRFAWRMLMKQPAFALTAILTLGLAIGANTAVFTVVDAVLMKPLPFPQPERLGLLASQIVGQDSQYIGQAGPQWFAVRDDAKTVDAAVYSSGTARVNFVRDGQPMSVAQQRVGAGYFGVLGVSPALGREFTAEEDLVNGPAVVVLSHSLWRAAFGGDPAVVGKTILLRGEPSEVIGVMPARFHNPIGADLWTPLRPSLTGEGGGQNYLIVLRLRPEATWAQAAAEMAAIVDPTLANQTSDAGRTMTHGVMPLQEGQTEEVRQPLLMLWGAVGLVLLVACVNLAGLLLARAGQRSREIATRLAIGGDRRNVVTQLLIESLVIAGLGGVLGLMVGYAGLEALRVLAGEAYSTLFDGVSLDGRAIAATMAVTIGAALLFGLTPALQATRVDVQAALSAGGTRSIAGGASGWPRRILIAGEVALVVVLLVGAGLLLRTFAHLQGQSPGFDLSNILTASVSLQDARYATNAPMTRLFDESLARIRSTPQVESAAVALGLPYERILNMGVAFPSIGQPQGRLTTVTFITPGYFDATRIPIVGGRVVSDTDSATSQRVAVVNREFVRRFLAEHEPIGQEFRMSGNTYTIVGVVGNVQQRGGFNGFGPIDTLPMTYVPYAQMADGVMATFHTWFTPKWIVRGRGGIVGLEPVIRDAIAEADGQLPVVSVKSADEVRATSLSFQRLLMTVVGTLGTVALLLAAIGIHALIASAVSERLRELGVRMALGASIEQAMRTVMLPGIVLTLVGLAVGSVLALGAAGLIQRLLWGVRPADPVTFVGVALVLLLVAVVASLGPALRVRRVDPATLLRE